MTQHTPGPWKPQADTHNIIGHSCYDEFRFIMSNDGIVARISNSQTQAADARLIAAAPDLLAALVDLVEWLDKSGLAHTRPLHCGAIHTEQVEFSVVTDARAAIAQAQGAPQ